MGTIYFAMLTTHYNNHPLHLIQSVEELDYIRSLIDERISNGIDTETTGLCFNNCQQVGVCISCGKSYRPEEYHGFYIPLRHTGYDKNLPIDKVIELVQYIVDTYKTTWWNRNFDFTFLEKDGFKAPFIGNTHDGQIMAYLVKGESFPALKPHAKTYLKYDVIDFEENNAKDHNFGTTDPEVSYKYAALDPIITVLTSRKIWIEYPYIHKIYPLDNKFAESIRRLSHMSYLYTDKELLAKFNEDNNRELSDLKRQIFAITGYQFKINSNKDKADALSMFVTLTAKTNKGSFAVNEEALSKIDHPLAKLLLKFSELETYRGSFLEKYINIDNPFRINYQHINVPTGRMSSGTSKGNSFFAPANIQNVPKTEMIRYLHVGSELGYYVDESPIDAIDKIKVKGGLRDAFIPPEGFVWLCADYQAEEMRVMANLSGEQNLINPILSGEDIHKYVGTKMFGSYDPSHRTVAKTINFAANYGAGGYTIAQKLGVSEEQGTEYLAKYNASLPQLTRWKQEMMNEGRRKGVVFTYMGRPRAVWQYYKSSDYKMHAYADRTCVNTVVQGLGGDLIRLDHIKIMTKFIQDPEFAENVKYSMTVHDEISLFVRPDYLKRAFHFLKELMYYKPANFPVPIIAEPAVGTSWSNLIDCDDVTEDGKLIINKYEGKDVSELIAKFREENKELYE